MNSSSHNPKNKNKIEGLKMERVANQIPEKQQTKQKKKGYLGRAKVTIWMPFQGTRSITESETSD